MKAVCCGFFSPVLNVHTILRCIHTEGWYMLFFYTQYFSHPTDLHAFFSACTRIDLISAVQGGKTMMILHAPYLRTGHQGGFQLLLIAELFLLCASV